MIVFFVLKMTNVFWKVHALSSQVIQYLVFKFKSSFVCFCLSVDFAAACHCALNNLAVLFIVASFSLMLC